MNNKIYGYPPLGKETYINPLIIEFGHETGGDKGMYNPDPYVMRYNGEYYCYSTSAEGVNLLHSQDSINWTYMGYALKAEGQRDYWAPCVYYYNGTFYMYYSSVPEGVDDCHYEYMKVAVSSSPYGPFEYKNTLFGNFSIDAHVVRDINGEFYLFYSTNDVCGVDGRRPGTVILMDKLKDMMTPQGNPRLIVRPTIDEEIYARNRFGDGRDWHTIEGAFYFKRGRRHYVMYSGNAYTNEDYFVGYSTSPDLGDIESCRWEKWPDDHTYLPLLRRNDVVEGTGHNSVEKAPNLVDDWIFYHGREILKEDTYKERRQLRMDPVYWLGDKMHVNGPSYTAQDRPGRPTFMDTFNRTSGRGLGENWRTEGGSWCIKGGEACQESTVGISKAITKIKAEDYVFEGSLKWVKHHMGGLYGFYGCYQDDANNMQVLIDQGRRELVVCSVVNGIEAENARVELEKGFDASAYHTVRVVKRGQRANVYLDGVLRYLGEIPLKQGTVGLLGYYTTACFDGITVTRHFETFFDDVKESRNHFCIRDDMKNWKFNKGYLSPDIKDESSAVLFCGEYPQEFKAGAHISFGKENGEGTAGILPVYKDEKNYFSVTANPSSGKIVISAIENGNVTMDVEKDWPEITLQEGAAFSFVRMKNHLRVMVDGEIVYDGGLMADGGLIGMIAIGASCRCDYFSITEWI